MRYKTLSTYFNIEERMSDTTENTLQNKVNLTKYAPDRKYEYELDQTQDWVQELLMELNEKATSRNPEDYLGETHINIRMTVKKVNNSTFGPVLLVKGSVESEFVTECVRTLEEMKDQVEAEFKAAFVENIFAEEEEYQDQDELFIDNDVYEMHYYELNKADVKEMIHEAIFLHINPYPVADHDAPLPYADEPGKLKQ